jgi:hypothetical protein
VRRLDKGFAGFEAWAEQVEQAEAEDERRLNVALKREHALAGTRRHRPPRPQRGPPPRA